MLLKFTLILFFLLYFTLYPSLILLLVHIFPYLTICQQVTLASGASNEDLEKAKQQVKDQGGEIVNEFTLIKGFTCVLLPPRLPPTTTKR